MTKMICFPLPGFAVVFTGRVLLVFGGSGIGLLQDLVLQVRVLECSRYDGFLLGEKLETS